MQKNVEKMTINYSPNFDLKKRHKNEIKFLIFHYTGMKNEVSAINRLQNPKFKVSSHYFIKKNGEIFSFKNNNLDLDYGYTIITKHTFEGTNLFALYGHLSKSSLEGKKVGQKVYSGVEMATIGYNTENGGWPPHVHFQLSLIEPKTCDLPGVVSEKNHEMALKIFPDPRLVLGNLY